jgi:tetratricopeptide (TPR) repeat protein
MVTGAAPVNPSLLIKNIGFILINLPFAGRRAVEHFNKAAQILRRTDSASALGNVYLELGRFYQKKGKKALASENLNRAIQLYQQS